MLHDMQAFNVPPDEPEPFPRTLVVVPTLDEASNVWIVLSRIRAAMPEADVLVVDDGSRDGTPQFAEAAARRLGRIEVMRRNGPRGLGLAYRDGFRYGLDAGYEVLVEMDADLSHDPDVLPRLVEAVREDGHVAIGSRYVPGGETPGWPAHRRFLSKAGGWYARTLLRLPVRDVTSGYRAYRADVLDRVGLEDITTTGYAFQIEMTERAVQAGAELHEVPIVFRDRRAGQSKMSGAIVREALTMVTKRALRRSHRERSQVLAGLHAPVTGMPSAPPPAGPPVTEGAH
jgi:dolichol-phosphate mannosyltransferase